MNGDQNYLLNAPIGFRFAKLASVQYLNTCLKYVIKNPRYETFDNQSILVKIETIGDYNQIIFIDFIFSCAKIIYQFCALSE